MGRYIRYNFMNIINELHLLVNCAFSLKKNRRNDTFPYWLIVNRCGFMLVRYVRSKIMLPGQLGPKSLSVIRNTEVWPLYWDCPLLGRSVKRGSTVCTYKHQHPFLACNCLAESALEHHDQHVCCWSIQHDPQVLWKAGPFRPHTVIGEQYVSKTGQLFHLRVYNRSPVRHQAKEDWRVSCECIRTFQQRAAHSSRQAGHGDQWCS